jgi:hypothetical protein
LEIVEEPNFGEEVAQGHFRFCGLMGIWLLLLAGSKGLEGKIKL